MGHPRSDMGKERKDCGQGWATRPLQLVLEFGALAATSLADVAKELVPTPSVVEVLYADKTSYEPLADSSADVSAMMSEGIISSFILRPAGGAIRYVLGLCPHFDGDNFSCWLGTVEFTCADYAALWERLLARHDLLFVCLGFEEGVQIVDRGEGHWFSWSDPTLVVGAIRGLHGRWDVRRGTKYDEVQLASSRVPGSSQKI